MDRSSNRAYGWVGFSAIVLAIGGAFAAIDGLVAVYRSTFFTENAVFIFSDLNTWGWIIFGLGVAGVVSGLAVLSGSEWARWLGVAMAFAGALGQLLFAQAYPVCSLMITAVYFLSIYGLLAYGGRESAASTVSSLEDASEPGEAQAPADVTDMTRARRVA